MPRQTINENGASTFGLDGFSFDCKEVFILLLGHLGSAGVGVNSKATCQERTRQLWSAIALGVNDL